MLSTPQGKLLGVPFRCDDSRVRLHAPFAIDFQKTQAALWGLCSVFVYRPATLTRPAQAMIDIRTLIRGIRSVVFPAALHPACVVQLATHDLDVAVRQHVKILLGLPNNFPSELLHWLLRLWPSRFEVDRRTLEFAWRLRHQHWIGGLLERASDAAWERHRDTGPLAHILKTLQRYGMSWDNLSDMEYAPPADFTPSPGRCAPGFKKWRERAWEVVQDKFYAWVLDRRVAEPASSPWRCFIPETIESMKDTWGSGFYAFLSDYGDHARAGLRLLAPQLGRWAERDGSIPACCWCSSPHGECGAHLLHCPRLPPFLLTHRDRVRDAIRSEVASSARGSDLRDQRILEHLFRLSWPGQTPETLANGLFYIGRLLDAYAATATVQLPRGQPRSSPYIPALKLHPRPQGAALRPVGRNGIWG